LSGSNNKGLHSILGAAGSDHTLIKVRTLDSLFLDKIIDILKIDVEGAEPRVLQGARRMVEAGRIRKIIIEYNPTSWSGYSSDWDNLRDHFDIIQIPVSQTRVSIPDSGRKNLYLRAIHSVFEQAESLERFGRKASRIQQ
jgi:hypothetical protein